MNYFPEVNKDKYALQKLEPTVILDFRADIALKLIERWGAIAGKLDSGEDSAGRSKFTLQEPAELIQRCFSIAEGFVNVCEDKGYIKKVSLLRETEVSS